jgi:hypothetical protein
MSGCLGPCCERWYFFFRVPRAKRQAGQDICGHLSGLSSGAQPEARQPGQMQMSGYVRVREIEQVRVVLLLSAASWCK